MKHQKHGVGSPKSKIVCSSHATATTVFWLITAILHITSHVAQYCYIYCQQVEAQHNKASVPSETEQPLLTQIEMLGRFSPINNVVAPLKVCSVVLISKGFVTRLLLT